MLLNNTICPGVVAEILNPELWTISVILSAMAYGAVLSLTLSYVSLLLKTSYDISQRMRIFLLVYVMFMFAMSTVYIIIIINAFRTSLPIYSSVKNCDSLLDLLYKMSYLQNGLASVFCITFASWGADGFMVSKCQNFKNIKEKDCFDSCFRMLYVALAMCDFISGSFDTMSNSFDCDSQLSGVDVTWCAPSQCCLFLLIFLFIQAPAWPSLSVPMDFFRMDIPSSWR